MDGSLWRVTPAYFQAFQIPLRQGRDFGERDRPASNRVAIVNEIAAKRWWPDRAGVLGEQILIGDPPQAHEIVGVVGAVRGWLNIEPGPQIYVPLSQNVQPSFADRAMAMRLQHVFVIRTSADPESVMAGVRSAMREVEADVPVERFQSMVEAIGDRSRPWRSTLLLLSLTGGLSLLLAAIGIYAVLSYTTSQRANEIGIRVALGAEQRDVVWLVMKGGLVLLLIGAIAGTATAWGLRRFLASQLFGVEPLDPVALCGAVAALLLAGSAACYMPARRACRVDPATALRQE